MPPKGPKNKTGEFDFFQIDPNGEIKPANPDSTPVPQEPAQQWQGESTPVEWNAEPNVDEPAPLWQMDPANESKEPSIVLENVQNTEIDIHAPTQGSGDFKPFESDEHAVETLHQDLFQAPQASAEEETPVENISVDEPSLIQPMETEAPAVILEEWQEERLGSLPPDDLAPLAESEIPVVETSAIVEKSVWDDAPLRPVPESEARELEAPIPIREIPSIESESQEEQDSAPAASSVWETNEGTQSDLSQRLQSQMDLLQRQVSTIHTLGPEKKLNENQIDVLRKYIALKEAESRDLIDQKRQYQTFLQKLDSQVKTFAKKNQDLVVELDMLKAREENNRKELLILKDKYREDIQKAKADYEQKISQAAKASNQVVDFDRKRDEWKGKIKEELKRIRLKEKELENKYELLKRDTQALLDSKDHHVLELKRKSDALELEMDGLEDRLRQSNVLLSQMDSKKRRLIETLRLALALLEQLDKPESGNDGSGGSSSNAG